MIHRRALLQGMGLVAVASAIPMLPAPAVAKIEPMAAIAAEFRDPLYVVAFTRGLQGERYFHHMPATARYEDGDKIWCQSLVIECVACFTGTVVTIEVRRGDELLFTMDSSAMVTPHVTDGSDIRLTLTGSYE